MTDYTQEDTFQYGLFQQYRVLMYIRDLLRNWFSDSRNIKDKRILSMLYDSQGNFKQDSIKVGTPFNFDHKYAGTTPSICVMLGQIAYSGKGVNSPGNGAFDSNPMQPIVAQTRMKMMPIQISITSQSYDGTVLLTQLVEVFLQVNSNHIQKDCKMLAYFQVAGISATQPVQQQSPSAKQLYTDSIQLTTAGYLCWTQNTQGPVYNGLTIKTNLTNQGLES